MPAIIIYSLVLLFFIGFPLLVIFFARSSEPSLQPEHNKVPAASADIVSCGFLAAIFALLFVLAFVTRRSQS